jgi:hypothetical protein
MAFDWRDFLDAARTIQAHTIAGTLGPPEAMYRTVVGRAYYAAFGYAGEYAAQWLGFTPKGKLEERSQDHGRLRAHFKRNRRQRVAADLQELREHRNGCDYQATIPTSDFAALGRHAIDLANAIIGALPPPRGTP